MTVDLLEMRKEFTASLYHGIDQAVVYVGNLDGLDIAIGFLGVACILGAYEWHRRWVKGKGYRMAVEQERNRIAELLSEGLTDMILDWEVRGKLSRQQADRLYSELSNKLGLPGLIPTKRRAKIIKNEIKSRLRSPKHSVKAPNIPGGKPEPIVRKKFRQTAGSLIQKFWKTV